MSGSRHGSRLLWGGFHVAAKWSEKIVSRAPTRCLFRSIIGAKEVAVGNVRIKPSTYRLTLALRMCAVAVIFPVIALVIVCATLLHPIASIRGKFHTSLRLWMSVLDWVKGIPIGYTYWVSYQAPALFDEIAVHHDE